MPRHIKYKKQLSILFLIFVLFYFIQTWGVFYYPKEINIVKGDKKDFHVFFPFTLKVSQQNNNIIDINSAHNFKVSLKKSYSFDTVESGLAKLQFKLFGIIPVKTVEVNVVERTHLVPMGSSIGVRLNTKGVLVVSVTDIVGIDGKKYNPAKEAGIRAGDNIVEIDGQKVKDAEHVIKLLNNIQNNKVSIIVERNNINFTTEVKPVKSIQDNYYRLGIWVRDKTAGIGTLTFYDEDTNVFGALGHGITDMDTGKLLNVKDGKIMGAKISEIEQGRKGNPGEIRGIFYETEDTLGNISKNTSFGIYGELNTKKSEIRKIKSMPIAFQEEVKEGKAYILTTLADNRVEKFEVEITKLQNQLSPEQKSMVLKVTDQNLLQETGGIVQGMSGSPIIQDNKIIGAVTHVFVNDPTKGYGLYIEWMLKQTDINTKKNIDFSGNRKR